MPLDVMTKLERQDLVIAAPRPALRQFRNDRFDAVLRHVLIENNEIAVDRHERHVDGIGRAFVDRGAARTVPMIHSEDAALFRLARERNIVSRKRKQRRDGKRLHAPHDPSLNFGPKWPITATISWQDVRATAEAALGNWQFGLISHQRHYARGNGDGTVRPRSSYSAACGDGRPMVATPSASVAEIVVRIISR